MRYKSLTAFCLGLLAAIATSECSRDEAPRSSEGAQGRRPVAIVSAQVPNDQRAKLRSEMTSRLDSALARITQTDRVVQPAQRQRFDLERGALIDRARRLEDDTQNLSTVTANDWSRRSEELQRSIDSFEADVAQLEHDFAI